jgi:hypothetical protein
MLQIIHERLADPPTTPPPPPEPRPDDERIRRPEEPIGPSYPPAEPPHPSPPEPNPPSPYGFGRIEFAPFDEQQGESPHQTS